MTTARQHRAAAAKISRTLAAAGYRPLPSGSSRSREGIRVHGSVAGVTVSADFNTDRDAAAATENVSEVLTAASVDHTVIHETLIRIA